MLQQASELAASLAKQAREAARAVAKRYQQTAEAASEAARAVTKRYQQAAEEPIRPVKEISRGRSKLSVFEHVGDDRTLRSFWTLDWETAVGWKRLGYGSPKELSDMRQVVREAAEFVVRRRQTRAPGPERKDPGASWPVVSRVRLTPDGVEASVEKVLPSRDEAELDAKDSPRIAWHRPLADEPRPGERLTARVDPATGRIEGNAKLDLERRRLIWAEETRGKFHTFGRWFDPDSEPSPGQKVAITPVHEYRGMPQDHRITPNRRVEPGEPEKVQFVVVERDPKRPESGWVRAITEEREGAVAVKDGLEVRSRAIEQAAHNHLWKEVSFSPALRRHSHAVTHTTYARGRTRADVIERVERDGSRTATVLLTREVREPDGRTRTVGRAYDLDELRQLRRIVEASRREPTPEPERVRAREADPEARQGLLPLREKAEGPGRDSKPRAGRKPREEGRPREGRGTQEEKTPRGEGKNRENGSVVVGVWNDATPPAAGQTVTYTAGEANPEGRLMAKSHERTRRPRGGKPLYVVARQYAVLGKHGLAVVVEMTEDRDRAVKEAEALNRREQGKQRYLERTEGQRRQVPTPERGLAPGG